MICVAVGLLHRHRIDQVPGPSQIGRRLIVAIGEGTQVVMEGSRLARMVGRHGMTITPPVFVLGHEVVDQLMVGLRHGCLVPLHGRDGV